VVSVVLGALLAMVVVLSGTTAASAAGSCSGPIANGQIRVVIVVDPGDSGPRGPMATCLVVDAGTSGSQILAQRAAQIGLPSPRYAGSGLLCGLDGFPATACPVNNGGGAYDYWAYFNGRGGTWSYGHDNPFVHRMVDGEIMGWRYTTGTQDDGSTPGPRLAPSGSLFPPLTPATTSPPPPVVPSLPRQSGGAAGGSGSSPGGGGFVPVDPGTSTPAADGSAPTDTVADGAVTGDPTTTAAVEGGAGNADADAGEELAAAPASSSDSDTGRWVGVALTVAVVGALGVGAVTRSRARSHS